MIGRTTRGWMTAAALPVIVGALLAAGCGGSGDGGAAQAPSAASATTAPATTAPTTTPAAPLKPGTAAAGKQVFAQNCTGCHTALGTQAGYGPKLAGKGLSKAAIRTAVRTGPALMPAGLVEGQDLADVVAYVSSLQ